MVCRLVESVIEDFDKINWWVNGCDVVVPLSKPTVMPSCW